MEEPAPAQSLFILYILLNQTTVIILIYTFSIDFFQVTLDFVWGVIYEQVLGVIDDDTRAEYTEKDQFRIVYQAAQVSYFFKYYSFPFLCCVAYSINIF